MAYAALQSLSQAIEDILPHDQDYISFSTKHQMLSLHQNIISLQEFLQSVPINFTSMATPLETRLTDVANEVETLVEVTVKGSPCESMLTADEVTSAPIYFNSYIQEVSAILKKAEEMKEIFKQDTSARDSSTPGSFLIQSGSNDAKVGLDDSLKQILERVTGGMNALEVIPIVGMGGIGKTTLAKAVYDSVSKVGHFDVCFWVTVSQEYSIRDILLHLLPKEQNTELREREEQYTELRERDLGSLIKSVYQRLYGRRFLIVLDDMWDEEAWNGVMTAIPADSSNGSRVILTTRLSEVAETVSSSRPQHQMPLLHGEQSWDLLREKVYGSETCPPELEAVGRRIAENCKGLPLRIVVVAGILQSNRTEDYWREVERDINEAAGQLDAVLTLSYNNLPPHLKSCFLYLGAYPEDFHIPTEHLLPLWVAEGFVKPNATSKTLEEIAEEYLEDLVKRSLVLVWANTDGGKIETCGVHDVLRELSLIKAKEVKFLQCFTDGDIKRGCTFQSIIESQRRVSVLSPKYDSLSISDDDDICNIFTHSLLLMNSEHVPIDQQLSSLASRFMLLKVLYGVEVTRESRFSRLFELTNLRLLHFRIGRILGADNLDYWLSVPKSISKLQKLETLIVTTNDHMMKELILPVEIWKIHNLRHIHSKLKCYMNLTTELSEAYPVLHHLQTLSLAFNLKLTESLIVKIPNLKVMGVYYKLGSSNATYVSYFGLNNLVHLLQLEVLHLEVKFKRYVQCVPANFVFPNNLKKLSLTGSYIISWEQMSSMVGSLPNLQVLVLVRAVEGSTWEPEEGYFLQLKHLEMWELGLKRWGVESTHFPCLEKLVLAHLRVLREIPLDVGYIPTLQKLSVEYCSKEAMKSAEDIQTEQQSLANHILQVEIKHR